MFKNKYSDLIAAIHKSQAVIEFELDGTIITANKNFLVAMGYELGEIKGHNHQMFVDPKYAASLEYKRFWDALEHGEHQTMEFKRFGKGGREIWIQASYTPVLNRNGKPYKIVKFATDITKMKLSNFDQAGQVSAISKSQAVIEFELDGTIITANENFLNTVGYELGEIQGKPHAMFVEPDFAASDAYKSFWEALRRGEYQSSEYKRVGKGGREIWIQASYNPIVDHEGDPLKVVKFATDITTNVQARLQRAKRQKEFDDNLTEILQSVVEEANTQAESIASTSAQTAANVQSVATGVEEMTASVSEISVRANEARSISDEAVTRAKDTSIVVSSLAESVQKIGEVVEMINLIASQTNLLALNATIEAARAGESGKGFAVVASEVKELARQTATATEEIGSQISEIQTSTTSAVDAIEAISHVIGQVNEISTAISVSVEEQSAVTQEMATDMLEASRGVDEISNSMDLIVASTGQIEAASHELRESSAAIG